MDEKRREERICYEPPEFVSVTFTLDVGTAQGQTWSLSVMDCSIHGLRLLVTEIDSDLLKVLKPGDVIKDITFYGASTLITVDATAMITDLAFCQVDFNLITARQCGQGIFDRTNTVLTTHSFNVYTFHADLFSCNFRLKATCTDHKHSSRRVTGEKGGLACWHQARPAGRGLPP